MTEAVKQPAQSKRKITRQRLPQISLQKQPLQPGCFYTYSEVARNDSPFKVASPAALYRAIRNGKLKPKRGSGKPLLKGADLIAWIEGKEDGER